MRRARASAASRSKPRPSSATRTCTTPARALQPHHDDVGARVGADVAEDLGDRAEDERLHRRVDRARRSPTTSRRRRDPGLALASCAATARARSTRPWCQSTAGRRSNVIRRVRSTAPGDQVGHLLEAARPPARRCRPASPCARCRARSRMPTSPGSCRRAGRPRRASAPAPGRARAAPSARGGGARARASRSARCSDCSRRRTPRQVAATWSATVCIASASAALEAVAVLVVDAQHGDALAVDDDGRQELRRQRHRRGPVERRVARGVAEHELLPEAITVPTVPVAIGRRRPARRRPLVAEVGDDDLLARLGEHADGDRGRVARGPGRRSRPRPSSTSSIVWAGAIAPATSVGQREPLGALLGLLAQAHAAQRRGDLLGHRLHQRGVGGVEPVAAVVVERDRAAMVGPSNTGVTSADW